MPTFIKSNPIIKNIKSCFQHKFDNFFRQSFYHLGRFIADHYGYFIVVPIIFTAILATGFLRIHKEDDPEYLFSPTNGQARIERAILEDTFFLNYSSNFHPSRITTFGRFARVIITAKDGGDLLRVKVWDDIIHMNRVIQEVRVKLEDGYARFEDLCAKWGDKCLKDNILELHDLMPKVETREFTLSYPVMLNPITFNSHIFPYYFGGVEVDDDDVIQSVKALSLIYWLKFGNPKDNHNSALWEDAVLEALDKEDFPHISIAKYVSRTLEIDLNNNTKSITPLFKITISAMILFSIFSNMRRDCVRTKPSLGVISIISAILATISAFGFLMYLQVDFIGINMAAPFLMLGIGIDDMFVMLAAWQRTRLQDDVSERMAQTYADAAVSITITSLTDMLSFFIGAINPFLSVRIFCLYTGTAVLLTYIWHITFFGGCLALSGYMEKSQRHGFTGRKVKSKSESVNESCSYRFFCAGGISESDPWNPKDNKRHALMLFFRDYVAHYLNIPAVKAVVVAVFLLYLLVACWGCSMVNEGLERRTIALDDAYSIDFYDRDRQYFREYPYRVQVAITGNVTYSDPQTQDDLMELHQKFENLSYVTGPLYTESWMRAWFGFVERNQDFLNISVATEEEFCYELRDLYLSGPVNPYAQDVIFNEDGTRIVASRFIIQTYQVLDSNEDKDMMEELRQVAAESRFNVTVFHPLFMFFDQLLLVRTTSIQAISLAGVIMILVSLIFIPNPLCSLWVGFSIISIEVGVVGYMALWGVNLDSTSMMNLIMCIGFSVDFSAHISYSYLTAKVDTPDERVQECLYALGLPILQGALSTILGVMPLAGAPSYIFLTYFKIIFLVILFGAMHGIFLLPVLLSLLGPGSCSSNKKKNKELAPQEITNGLELHPSTHTDPNNLKILRTQRDTPLHNGTHDVTTQHNGASPYHKGPQDASPTLVTNNLDGNSLEKDLGHGTSGEESSKSRSSKGVTVGHSGPDTVNNAGGGHCELPNVEVYSNKGYISDDLEAEEQRAQEHSLVQHGEWKVPRRSFHNPRPSSEFSFAHRYNSARAYNHDRSHQSDSRERSKH